MTPDMMSLRLLLSVHVDKDEVMYAHFRYDALIFSINRAFGEFRASEVGTDFHSVLLTFNAHEKAAACFGALVEKGGLSERFAPVMREYLKSKSMAESLASDLDVKVEWEPSRSSAAPRSSVGDAKPLAVVPLSGVSYSSVVMPKTASSSSSSSSAASTFASAAVSVSRTEAAKPPTVEAPKQTPPPPPPQPRESDEMTALRSRVAYESQHEERLKKMIESQTSGVEMRRKMVDELSGKLTKMEADVAELKKRIEVEKKFMTQDEDRLREMESESAEVRKSVAELQLRVEKTSSSTTPSTSSTA